LTINPIPEKMKSVLKKINFKSIIYLAFFISSIVPLSVFSQTGKSLVTSDQPVAVVVSSDEINNNISLDLTRIPDFFRRAYLLDLLFSDPTLVVNNSNISGPSLELFSNKVNDVKQVLTTLETYYDKAILAEKTLNESQKNELMKKYAKYR
jgi:hypothetical protein